MSFCTTLAATPADGVTTGHDRVAPVPNRSPGLKLAYGHKPNRSRANATDQNVLVACASRGREAWKVRLSSCGTRSDVFFGWFYCL